MKSKHFVILLISCIFSGIVFIIAFFLYQAGRQKQISSGNETAAESSAERKRAESEGMEHSEKTEIETAGIKNIGKENIEIKDIGIENIKIEKDGAESENSSSYENAFYYTALTEDVKQRITGKSYPDTEEAIQISYDDLAYVHVLYYDFDAEIQEGELICNQAIAQDLVEIFGELYDNQYPIEKICFVDEYDADDEASMADNNTSCFNYRTVPGKTKLSNHSYGRAIDINPLYNPYVRTKNGETLISPDNAVSYVDRSAAFPHKIDKNDLCYKLFIQHGFSWGGAWNSSKDYQHFEK